MSMFKKIKFTIFSNHKEEWLDIFLMLFLSAVILCGQIENDVLYSVDGVVYATIGKSLSLKPFSEWVVLNWMGSSPFYEHPHLTPWILALYMKFFGVSTLSAIMPIVLLSIMTVFLGYLLGRSLLDHRLGILTGTVLTLTPQFIKNARNPMLEPALMFFITAAAFFYIRSTQSPKFFLYTILTGISVGLAFLAKGPPAFLALAFIISFQIAAHFIFPGAMKSFSLTGKRFAASLVVVVLLSAGMILFVDFWHQMIAGTSFFGRYIQHQLNFTIVESRGRMDNDWFFYIKIFFKYWPWLSFVLLSIPLALWKKDQKVIPALVVGFLITFGTYFGFTLMKFKAPWYIAIYFVASSLLVALSLRTFISERLFKSYFKKFCWVLILPTLFLSASFPSLFLGYGRPLEQFLEQLGENQGHKLEGIGISDCIPLDPWKSHFFMNFYLGTHKVECNDPSAKYKMIDHRNYLFEKGDRIIFALHPFSLIERTSEK